MPPRPAASPSLLFARCTPSAHPRTRSAPAGGIISPEFGADVFLADERGEYIGRICHWRDCRPGIRGSCDARHCGPRPYLHDDLDDVCLESALVERPPLTLWPEVEYRGRLPKDVEDVVKAFEETV